MAKPSKEEIKTLIADATKAAQEISGIRDIPIGPRPKSYIKPIITFDGHKHDLQKIQDESPDDMPEMKSVGFRKVGEKNHSWVSYVITTKGDKVLSMEVSEPDMRAIAEETAKISFVECFVDQEAF